MADTKISALTAATTVSDTDELPLNQSGTSKKVTVSRLNRKITNISVAAQSPTAGTNTLLTGSALAMPSGVTPNVATMMQWKLIVTKAAAGGTAAAVFTIYRGTTGTTSDTAMCTFTLGGQTGVADVGRVDIMLTFRAVGSGTTAVGQGSLTLSHSLASTGLLSVPAQTLAVTSAGFDSTVASTIYSIACNSGTLNAFTFNQVVAEAVNV